MARKPPPRTISVLGRQADRVAGAGTPPKRRAGNRKTRTAAKSAEKPIEHAVTDAVTIAQKRVNRRKLETEVARRNVDGALDAVGWEQTGAPALGAGYADGYRRAFEASAEAEMRALGGTYSVLNPHALTAMQMSGARFVSQVSANTRAELRVILVDMLNQGLSVRDTAARLIERIGLTARLSAAVDALGARLEARGLDPLAVRQAMARKSAELLRYRARLIAQTEAQNAAAAGQRASWAEAATQGLIDTDLAEMEWVTTSSPCPKICDPMDGQRRKVGELFETGDGRFVAGPGGDAHPNCLCTTVLHANRKRRAAAA